LKLPQLLNELNVGEMEGLIYRQIAVTCPDEFDKCASPKTWSEDIANSRIKEKKVLEEAREDSEPLAITLEVAEKPKSGGRFASLRAHLSLE